MKKLIAIILFNLFINLNSYEVNPGEIIKTKTLYVASSYGNRNFTLTKEEYKKAKDYAEMLDMAVVNFIEKIGSENVFDIKISASAGSYTHTRCLYATIIYKEKSFSY